MLSVDQAINCILATCKPKEASISVSLIDALGQVLAEDQKANVDMPPFDNSAMDGFAVNTTLLTQGPYELPLSQTIMAGQPALPLAQHSAARIFTGAIIPEGADAVIVQENCQYDDKTVQFSERPKAFANIRRQGEDSAMGTTLLTKGKRLSAQDISLLASGGVSSVMVNAKLRIAIISTGDELIMPGNALAPAQIYNSNYFLLQGLLKQCHADVIDIGSIKDDVEAIKQALLTASQYDMIITTGGVSVGGADLLKQVVTELGEIQLWKVAIKPGKPIAFGEVAGTPYFGLPGNPVSTFITFLLFVRPYIKKLKGESLTPLVKRQVIAGFSEKANKTRQSYLRVKVSDNGLAEKHSNQSSGALSSMSWANALAEIPANTEVVKGDIITVIDFSSFNG